MSCDFHIFSMKQIVREHIQIMAVLTGLLQVQLSVEGGVSQVVDFVVHDCGTYMYIVFQGGTSRERLSIN